MENMEIRYEIIKGSANYLLFVLNFIDGRDDHIMTAKEQLAELGPCQAIAYAPTRKALVNLCAQKGFKLI